MKLNTPEFPPKQEQGLTEYLLEIEHKDNKSDDDEAFLIFHHIVELYDGVNGFEDITPEIITHYEQVTYKEITSENRLLHSLSKEDRKKDFYNPCNAGKRFYREKGKLIDRLCEILEIEPNKNFHMQLKEKRIYKEDIVGSKWYKFVSNNKDEINLIWKLDVDKTFESDPLAFFKKFCLKAMGIVCTLEQPRGTHPDEHKKLVKEHNAKDIYRKFSEDGKNPRAWHKKKDISELYISQKIKDGLQLTIAEQQLRQHKKHVRIHNSQPRYKPYLSNTYDSSMLDINMRNRILKNKQKGGVQDYE